MSTENLLVVVISSS